MDPGYQNDADPDVDADLNPDADEIIHWCTRQYL